MIKFELITLDGTKFSEEVYEVVLPTTDGYIAVFENHASLVTLASPGVISVRRKAGDPDSRLEYFATAGGVIEILEAGKAVRVLVDEADREDEVSEKEAEAAFQRARQMRSEARDRVSLEHAQALVDRQASRLRVAELRRHKRRN